VFTSDNGGLCTLAQGKPGPTTNLPWRSGKGWNYEGGIRIPTFVAWPARLKPAVTRVPGITADLYPTLLDLCGLPIQPRQHVDGRSLAPVLRGRSPASLSRRSLAWYYPHDHGSGHRAGAALRRGPWKLIRYFASGKDELYHLGNDPGENSDLSARQPVRAQKLREELQRWIETTKR
jgi:arylsulfatase A-like enzyme